MHDQKSEQTLLTVVDFRNLLKKLVGDQVAALTSRLQAYLFLNDIHKQNQEMKSESVQSELKSVIKQGYVLKRSKFLKEWRERWSVLTKNYVLTFKQRESKKDATEVIKLSDAIAVKSYFGKNQEKTFSFAIKTTAGQFLFSCKSYEQRLQWLTQLDKAIRRAVQNPVAPSPQIQKLKSDSGQEYKQRLSSINKMSAESALSIKEMLMNPEQVAVQIRNSIRTQVEQLPDLKIKLQPQPDLSTLTFKKKQDQTVSIRPTTNLKVKAQTESMYFQQINRAKDDLTGIMYRQTVSSRSDELHTKLKFLVSIFEVIDCLESEKLVRNLVDLVCLINVEDKNSIRKDLVFVTMMHNKSRFFTELLIQGLNRESDSERVFNALLMVECLCTPEKAIFYKADLEVLINVILRQLQAMRSQIHEYVCLKVLMTLSSIPQYKWAKTFRAEERRDLLKGVCEYASKESKAIVDALLKL